jgi:glyoxylase-like metal-dependent hydrolase (beta-lactamase superfamily II)
MKIVELRPELHMLLPDFGQAYLWRDADSLTLIDTGCAGSGADIADAIRELGLRRRDLDRVILTHFHEDHAGSAAEVGGWGEVSVMAHRREAPVIRGDVAGPPPNFADWELDLHRSIGADKLPSAPPARVDRELEDGDLIEFGGGACVIATPGHTDGSIAIHLPEPGVLFTGDTVAHIDGQVMLGVFNIDRAQTADSFRMLAQVETDLVCVGHGDPITDGAAAALRAAAAQLPT